MATNYEINYDDKRFQEVEADKQAALNEVDVTYGNMINQSDKYFQQQIDASKDWADKQSQLQQEQTDFAIQEIEQQKAQTKKDYVKEQSGAYVDWQKQSNEYGANAEQMAASGMTNTGYSESSQVSMYNTYQNRVATAREAYNRAVLNYDNAITEARLQNNSILAEIAYESLQKQLELSLQGFQYKNQLVLEQANKKLEVDQMYHNRYQDVLKQINTENALAEEVRQYNATLAEEQRQFNQSYALQQAQLAEQKRQFDATMAAKSSSGGSSGGSSGRVISNSEKKKIAAENKAKKNAVQQTTANDKYSSAIRAGNTANANKKVKSLSLMQGQMGSQTAIANSIVAYAATGDINANEAAYMLDHFGYDPKKYLE